MEMQFDNADDIRHAGDLRYRVFTMTGMENNFETRAVTGIEIPI